MILETVQSGVKMISQIIACHVSLDINFFRTNMKPKVQFKAEVYKWVTLLIKYDFSEILYIVVLLVNYTISDSKTPDKESISLARKYL